MTDESELICEDCGISCSGVDPSQGNSGAGPEAAAPPVEPKVEAGSKGSKKRAGPDCPRCDGPGVYTGNSTYPMCCRKILDAMYCNARKHGWLPLLNAEKAKGPIFFKRLIRDFESGCPPGAGGRRAAFDSAQYTRTYYVKSEVVHGKRDELLDYDGYMNYWVKVKKRLESDVHKEWKEYEADPGAAPYAYEDDPVLAFYAGALGNNICNQEMNHSRVWPVSLGA